jgi:outer membrane protein assembly factor BamB
MRTRGCKPPLLLLAAALVVAGCNGHRYDGLEPSSAFGGWTAAGGDLQRRNFSVEGPAPPLVESWRHEGIICPWGVVGNDGVIVLTGLNEQIIGLDAATGEELWSWEMTATPNGPPQIVGDRVYLSFDLPLAQVWCLDLSTGSRYWARAPEESPRHLVADPDGVWVVTSRELLRVSVREGELVERYELPGRPAAGPPVLLEGEPYLLLMGPEGGAFWSPSRSREWTFYDEPAAGPLLLDDGSTAWANRTGEGMAYDPATAQVVPFGRALGAPPAGLAADGLNVLALGRNGELQLWAALEEDRVLLPPDGVTLTPPLWAGDRVWISRAEGDLEAYSLSGGPGAELEYVWETERAVLSLARIDGMLVVTTAGGAVVALVHGEPPAEEPAGEDADTAEVEDPFIENEREWVIDDEPAVEVED